MVTNIVKKREKYIVDIDEVFVYQHSNSIHDDLLYNWNELNGFLQIPKPLIQSIKLTIL